MDFVPRLLDFAAAASKLQDYASKTRLEKVREPWNRPFLGLQGGSASSRHEAVFRKDRQLLSRVERGSRRKEPVKVLCAHGVALMDANSLEKSVSAAPTWNFLEIQLVNARIRPDPRGCGVATPSRNWGRRVAIGPMLVKVEITNDG